MTLKELWKTGNKPPFVFGWHHRAKEEDTVGCIHCGETFEFGILRLDLDGLLQCAHCEAGLLDIWPLTDECMAASEAFRDIPEGLVRNQAFKQAFA